MSSITCLYILLLLCLTGLTTAQSGVVVIPKMTLPHSVLDMDKAGPAGPTTITKVNLAGSNGGGCLANIVVVPSITSVGVYNTSPTGRALGRALNSNDLILVDPPTGQFGSFNAKLYFAMDCNEVGLAIADWVGVIPLTFFSKGKQVATASTPSNNGTTFFFRLNGATFDRVDITCTGNFVIPEIVTQTPPNGYTPYGMGCVGSNGIPRIFPKGTYSPKLGNTMMVACTNLPLAGGAPMMALGTSGTTFGGLGNLPFDLTGIGATGCSIWCSIFMFIPFPSANGSGTHVFGIPPVSALLGAQYYNQAYIIEKTANPLGLILSNAAVGTFR